MIKEHYGLYRDSLLFSIITDAVKTSNSLLALLKKRLLWLKIAHSSLCDINDVHMNGRWILDLQLLCVIGKGLVIFLTFKIA